MSVVRLSTFCMRYIPTLRVPSRGSCVITAGSVMNGAGSPGQQRWIGSRSRSTSSPVRTTSCDGAAAHGLRPRVGDRLQLLEAAHLRDEPLGRLHLEHVAEPAPDLVQRRRAEAEAHPALGPELVDQQRVPRALDVLEEERRPAGLDDAVVDLGDLEVGIDLGGHANELTLALEERDPLPQVAGRRHVVHPMFR